MTTVEYRKFFIAIIAGLVIGLIVSVIPAIFWRKVALQQGRELLLDIIIILSIVLCVYVCINKIISNVALFSEILVMTVVASLVVGFVVQVTDRYGYEPLSTSLVPKSIVVAAIYWLPSVCILLITKKFGKL